MVDMLMSRIIKTDENLIFFKTRRGYKALRLIGNLGLRLNFAVYLQLLTGQCATHRVHVYILPNLIENLTFWIRTLAASSILYCANGFHRISVYRDAINSTDIAEFSQIKTRYVWIF